MMKSKNEQTVKKSLLVEAITVLCKASLAYRREFHIEGLLGITLDNEEIFLVNVNEHIRKDGLSRSPSPGKLFIEHRAAILYFSVTCL